MKYKVWDKVRYLKNTTESIAKVWEEYYITEICNDDKYPYLLWKEKWVVEESMWVKEGDIELVEEEFTSGEEVWISGLSKEDAIIGLNVDRNKSYYIWKSKEGLYITEDNKWGLTKWQYIAKIPKEEEMTLKELCKDLWRNIKIVK